MKPTHTLLETAQDLARCGYPAPAGAGEGNVYIALSGDGAPAFFNGGDSYKPDAIRLHTSAYLPDADEILAALFLACDGSVEVKIVGFHAGGFRHRVEVFSRNVKCIGRGSSLFEAAANCWCNLSEKGSHPDLVSHAKEAQRFFQNKEEQ